MDRAAEFRTDDAWLATRWADPATRVLHVEGGRIEVDVASEPPRVVLVEPYATDALTMLLGVEDGVAYFAVNGARPDATVDPAEAADAADAAEAAEAAEAAADGWRTLREVGSGLPDLDLALAMHALGLANWHEAHPRCPRCGAATVAIEAGHVRRCPVDGSLHHPRTDPAVIMLITDEHDRALLGRSARWDLPMFSTLAGFVEPGESAEEAVAREVHEESGVVVDAVTFVASQPWPFPSSLMLGFRGVARSAAAAPVADGEEMAEVRWFTREALAAAVSSGAVLVPPSFSIARRLIEDWLGAPL